MTNPQDASAMQVRPETRYARSGSVNIAYQVVGNGPLDLVLTSSWVTNVDLVWGEPLLARFLRRLASFSRLILFDKRGTGLSDRTASLPPLEARMDDVRAVMDAAGSERAVIFGITEGGALCALFAATYPERTAALVMYGAYPKRTWSRDYPWAPTRAERQRWMESMGEDWGGAVRFDALGPSLAGDEQLRAWWAAYTGERLPVEPDRMHTTILVTDIIGSTGHAAALGDDHRD